MLTQSHVDQFQQNGFLKGSRVLDDTQVERLRAELARVIDGYKKPGVVQPVYMANIAGDSAPVWQIVNIWKASDAFRDLVFHPQIAEECAQLITAEELRLWHDQIQYKPAATGGVNMWHQDSPYWPCLTPKDAQITAWIALDDVDVDNGCMQMVPGSNGWGDQIQFLHSLKETGFDSMPDSFEGHRVEVVCCPVEKGAVHFHHSLTWHGSGENTSGRPRRAIALHYMTEATRYLRAGKHPIEPFITVQEGEIIAGEHFPVVWEKARAAPCP